MVDLKRTLFSICTLIYVIKTIAVVFKNITIFQVFYLRISKSPSALHLQIDLLWQIFIQALLLLCHQKNGVLVLACVMLIASAMVFACVWYQLVFWC